MTDIVKALNLVSDAKVAMIDAIEKKLDEVLSEEKVLKFPQTTNGGFIKIYHNGVEYVVEHIYSGLYGLDVMTLDELCDVGEFLDEDEWFTYYKD